MPPPTNVDGAEADAARAFDRHPMLPVLRLGALLRMKDISRHADVMAVLQTHALLVRVVFKREAIEHDVPELPARLRTSPRPS